MSLFGQVQQHSTSIMKLSSSAQTCCCIVVSLCGIKRKQWSSVEVVSTSEVSHFEVCLVRKQIEGKSQNLTKDLANVLVTYFEP